MFMSGDQLRPETGAAASMFDFVSILNDLFVQFVAVYFIVGRFVDAFMLASSVGVNES